MTGGMLLCDAQGCWCAVAEFSMSLRNVAVLLCDAQGCWCAVAEFSTSLRDGLRHHDRRGRGPHGEGGRDGHAQSL